MTILLAASAGCASLGDDEKASDSPSWSALMEDGDPSSLAPAGRPPAPMTLPRFCPGDDCTAWPLAAWTFDDCSPFSTQLSDSAVTSPITHPAFRAVSAACVPGVDGQAVRLDGADDVVYAPDQPDFNFDAGLTVAAWINPDRVTGTQSIVRKRLDGTSAFLLAIDGRKLVFVVRLKSGRLVGLSTRLEAGRFTHVAATYDGHQAVLYTDGVAAAQARATGTLASGAGPIFIGNDANGRRFRGVVDGVWLNTLAAPADVVRGLTCIRQAPVVSLSPAEGPPTQVGTPVAFDLSVTNPSGPECPVDTFQFFGQLFFPLTADQTFGFLAVGPGETGHVTINVLAFTQGVTGPVPFQYFVANTVNFGLQAVANATFVIEPLPPPGLTGCPDVPNQPVAPGGYYVNGNTVCTPEGRPHIFHGVDRPSLEWDHRGSNLRLSDFQHIASWNANVVRVGLNQDFWIAESPLADPSYPALVDSVIRWAETAGMDVILDLHWSDRGVLGSCNPVTSNCQQLMPDANSATFWSQVAERYKDDGRVMFELYNEPHDEGFGTITWDVWRNGGDTGQGWQAVGMQQLYDTVRATGAENVVLIGGLDWAYDLSGVPSHRIAGHNIAYTTHPYRFPGAFLREPQFWDQFWGFLTRTDPVVATEFGDLGSTTCDTDYASQVIAYADANFAGWTSWAWWPNECTGFQGVITDFQTYAPAPLGQVVKAALLGYDDPPASPPYPGPGPVPGIYYPFDLSTEGWAFNDFDDPASGLTNIAVVIPPGGRAPVLSHESADGDPVSGPGALAVTAPFTAFNQFVDLRLILGQPYFNLAGGTLHARVKVVSGPPTVAFTFFALSGPAFAFSGHFYDPSQFPIGEWVPITLDLVPDLTAGFDPTQVFQFDIQILSGFSTVGDSYPGGDVVVEVDTVTE